jgi:hypothetical protein
MDFDIDKWQKRFVELQNILDDSDKNLSELTNIKNKLDNKIDYPIKNEYYTGWCDKEPNPFIVEIENANDDKTIRKIILIYHLYCCRLSSEYLKTCYWYIGDLTFEKALDIHNNSKKMKNTVKNMIIVGTIFDKFDNYTFNRI